MFGDSVKDVLGSRYLRLTEDEPLEVVFLPGERIAYTRWDGAKTVAMSEAEALTHGVKYPNRFAVNVYVPDDVRVALLDGPLGLAKSIRAARPDERDVLRLERFGMGKDTTYKVRRVRKLDDAELGTAQDLETHDLDELWGGVPVPQAHDQQGGDGIPF